MWVCFGMFDMTWDEIPETEKILRGSKVFKGPKANTGPGIWKPSKQVWCGLMAAGESVCKHVRA